MLARKEDAYLYDIPVPAEAAPAVQAEVPREPLLRHQLNTNLRNCLRAVFFLVACGAMAVTLLGGIGLALMPGAQEYRECRAAALTQTDMYTCDQKFQGTMDKLTGTSSSSSSAAR